jgi:hypothetical protein
VHEFGQFLIGGIQLGVFASPRNPVHGMYFRKPRWKNRYVQSSSSKCSPQDVRK